MAKIQIIGFVRFLSGFFGQKNMESYKISIVNLIFIRFFLKRQCYHPPDIFIFSLTIADFFIGAIIMPIGLCKVRISFENLVAESSLVTSVAPRSN